MKTIATLLLSSNLLWAIEIQLRYDLDTSGFFDQPGAKEAMEAAAEFYEELIVDELEAINPEDFQVSGSFTRTWTPTYLEPGQANPILIDEATNMVVPENTLIVFVAARALDTSGQGGPGGINFGSGDFSPFPWLNQLVNRGEEGAVTIQPNQAYSINPTDFAPWGGSIFFDSNSTWNFSTTDALATPGIDFVAVALHELGHVLGLGIFQSQASSWFPLIALDANNYPFFNGPLSVKSHGQTLYTFDYVHWSNFTSVPTLDSPTLEAFGRSHGELQRPLMLPVGASTNATRFSVPTDLDVAALQDIGWEIQTAPDDFAVEVNLAGDVPQIGIPTTTGINYSVNRAETLDGLEPVGETIEGDGSVKVWSDPVSGSQKAFYQVEASVPAAVTRRAKTAKKETKNASPTISDIPFVPAPLAAEQCACGAH